MTHSNLQLDNDCPICMDKLQVTNISVTKCGHSFCLQCIIKHSKSGDNRCPLCRANITHDDSPVPMNNHDHDELHYRLMDSALRRRLIYISSFITPSHEYDNIVRLSSTINQYDASKYNIDFDIYTEHLIHPPPPPTPPTPPPQQQTPLITRRCGICKQTGHNRRTCPTTVNNQH